MKINMRSGLSSLPRPGDPGYRLRRSVRALQAALAANQTKAIRKYFDGLAPADIGDMLRKLGQPELAKALPLVADEQRTEVFVYLPMSLQLQHVRTLNRSESSDLFNGMPPDERADLFMRLTEEEQQRVLPALAQAEREDIRRLISYKEGTAGAIMTSEYASLRADQSIEEALLELRRIAPDRETIYTSYVVDENRRLIGVTSLRDLILAEPHARVRDVMEHRVVRAKASDSQRAAARKIAKFDIIALPIIDVEDRIVGIVTADDAMDVAAAESTAAMHRGSAVGELSESLLESSVRVLFKKRVFWLVVLVFGNMFSAEIIDNFEDLIAANVVLVMFMPLLVDSGGNAGAQSATLAVRALGTGEIEVADWAKMLFKDLSVSMLLALAMAVAVALVGYWRGDIIIAGIVALTMMFVVVIGSVIGMMLPFIFTRLNLDPASASGPLITSLVDGVGVLIYFVVASQILSIYGPGL